MANLSQQKRRRMLAFLETIRAEHKDDDEALTALGEIESALSEKKYGLVWERHEEAADEKLQDHIPVFTEVPEREICASPGGAYHFLLEGDNLHSLRLLEKTLAGKVDVIYIDPPYNTGNSFVYSDETVDLHDAFRHSKWLSFMEERLRAAHRLLSNNGIIFISIDDNEQAGLKLLCDEIFGENNFFTQIIVQSNIRGQTYRQIAKTHEYILVYTKTSDAEFNEIEKTEQDSDLNLTDDIGRYNVRELRNRNPKFGRFNRPNLYYPFYVNPSAVDEDGFCPVSLTPDANYCEEVYPFNSKGAESCWRWSRQLAGRHCLENTRQSNLVARKKRTGGYNIYEKYRKTTYKAKSIWFEKEMITEHGTVQLGEMGLADKFQFPKPVELISKCLQIGSKPDSLVLDFFAGSGTTGQAVLELNRKDGGHRRFILCTNNENNICEEVAWQRLKTVITGIRPDGAKYSEGIPSNLKYYRTDFVPKDAGDLGGALLAHVKEMIQLERGVKMDGGARVIVILSDEEADELEKSWDAQGKIRALYISRDVLLTASQSALFGSVETHIIPDDFFKTELQEAGEAW